MADELFQEPEDATPLTPEERTGLIPAHIAYRAELNAAEQENIARGQDWALARKRDLLSEKFIKDLHGAHAGRRVALGGQIPDNRTKSRYPLL